MAKLSVIIPVYNTENYLRKCLDSVINQTLQDIELIIINDGSIDNSQEIIDEYTQKYGEEIKCIIQKNSGQAVARNVGISLAEGEYIAFADSDDFLEKDAYEIAYNYAKEHDLDIVCFDFFEIKVDEKTKSNYYRLNVDDNVKKYILNETSPCNKIIKSDILQKNDVKFLEKYIYEDLATIPTLALYTYKIGYIDKCLYNYIIREKSTMRQQEFNNKLKDIYIAMEYLYSKYSNTQYKLELEYLYIEHLLHGASLRFLNYKQGIQEIHEIAKIMKNKYPNWRKNPYYKKQNIKYKIICNLLYGNNVELVKKLLKINSR